MYNRDKGSSEPTTPTCLPDISELGGSICLFQLTHKDTYIFDIYKRGRQLILKRTPALISIMKGWAVRRLEGWFPLK